MLLLIVLAWVFGAGSLALFAVFLWAGNLPILDLGLSKSSLFMSSASPVLRVQHRGAVGDSISVS